MLKSHKKGGEFSIEKLPVFSADLILELDKMYPDKCPSLNETPKEIWFKAGQRDVVNMLLSRLDELNEDMLEKG